MRRASKPEQRELIGKSVGLLFSPTHFVAYIEALVGAAPYYRTTDPRAKLDAHFAKAFDEFNKQDSLRFNQYVARKLLAWFTLFPPTLRVLYNMLYSTLYSM